MSRGFSGNEKCVFCGWTRRSAYQSVRFFCIPKDPGLKRVRWLQVFGDRDITAKDRVCSVHFRQGRPSSDPSHEDFVPHLYLNNEPPAEVIDYLESLADTRPEKMQAASEQSAKLTSSLSPSTAPQNAKNQKPEILGRNPKPSILKRKRPKNEAIEAETLHHSQHHHSGESAPPLVDEEEYHVTNDAHAPEQQQHLHAYEPQPEDDRPVKLTLIQRQIADAVGLKPGQTVVIRRRVIRK